MSDDNLQPYDELSSLCANLDGRYRDIGSDFCEECSASDSDPDSVEANHATRQATVLEEWKKKNENWLTKNDVYTLGKFFNETEGEIYGRGVTAGKLEALQYTPEERERYGQWSLGSGSPRVAASTATPSGEALKQQGIARVSGNNKEWLKSCVDYFTSNMAQWLFAPFTGEDLRLILEGRGLKPNHVNAWGALVNALVRKGLIKFTGEMRTPKDRSSHARMIKVYRRV